MFLALRCALAVCAAASAGCAASEAVPAAPSGVPPATFAIRLNRAHDPGDHGMISTIVRSRRTTVVQEGDRISKREADDREVDLEAMVDVLHVDAAGIPVSLAYTIEHLVVRTPAGTTEVLPGGWVVGAEPVTMGGEPPYPPAQPGGRRVTFRSAEPLPAEARKALDETLSPLSSESTDDDIFGTAEPQAIGAVWPVNAALTAKELARMHLDVPAEAVHGQSRLVGLVEAGGQACLDIAGELSISDSRIIDVPGARTDSAELRSTYHTLIPVDATSPAVDSMLRVDLDVTARVTLGPDREGRMTTTSHQERRRRFTPLLRR
jgi:hypothetical protein